MSKYTTNSQPHSQSWVIQAWISFVASTVATAIGISYMPIDNWMKGYMGMGLMFSVGSTISLSKTLRDIHESQKILSRVDEAKLEKILAEHDPFRK